MKIPKRLKVGAHVVRVKFRDHVTYEGEEVCGLSQSAFDKIDLAKRYQGKRVPEGSLADTFLHEVIHVASSHFGIGLKEDQVTGLAGALLHVIRDNNLDFRK